MRLYALAWGKLWPLEWRLGALCSLAGPVSDNVTVVLRQDDATPGQRDAEYRRLARKGFQDVRHWRAGEAAPAPVVGDVKE